MENVNRVVSGWGRPSIAAAGLATLLGAAFPAGAAVFTVANLNDSDVDVPAVLSDDGPGHPFPIALRLRAERDAQREHTQ